MLHTLTDPLIIIKTVGLFGVVLIVFAESGLFFGFFFPGDSLLFTAGFLASQGFLSPVWLFLWVFLASVLGDSVGYAFGHRVGPVLFKKDDSIFFNKRYPEQAKLFYERYGKKAIIYARFVPVVRTFAPIIAGIGAMQYLSFLTYNIVGGALWTLLLTGAGYVLGNSIPSAEHYITPIIVLIIVISILPAIFQFLQERGKRRR